MDDVNTLIARMPFVVEAELDDPVTEIRRVPRRARSLAADEAPTWVPREPRIPGSRTRSDRPAAMAGAERRGDAFAGDVAHHDARAIVGQAHEDVTEVPPERAPAERRALRAPARAQRERSLTPSELAALDALVTSSPRDPLQSPHSTSELAALDALVTSSPRDPLQSPHSPSELAALDALVTCAPSGPAAVPPSPWDELVLPARRLRPLVRGELEEVAPRTAARRRFLDGASGLLVAFSLITLGLLAWVSLARIS